MASAARPASPAHVAGVEQVGGRYPWRPTCSCGWACRGYVAEHAAQIMADDHAARAA